MASHFNKMPELVCDPFEICSQPSQQCLKLSVADWWVKQFYALPLGFAKMATSVLELVFPSVSWAYPACTFLRAVTSNHNHCGN